MDFGPRDAPVRHRPPESRFREAGKRPPLVFSLRSTPRRLRDALGRHLPGALMRRTPPRDLRGSQGGKSPRGIARPFSGAAAESCAARRAPRSKGLGRPAPDRRDPYGRPVPDRRVESRLLPLPAEGTLVVARVEGLAALPAEARGRRVSRTQSRLDRLR